MTSEDFNNAKHRNYCTLVLRPQAWIGRADDLLKAAAGLLPDVRKQMQRIFVDREFIDRARDWHSVGPIPTYYMLIAFALENLLKAALIRRDESKLRDEVWKTGTLPEELRTHDLYRMMHDLEIAPADRVQEELIRRITRGSKWYGRYPVPATVREYGTVRYSDGKEYSGFELGANDIEALVQLVRTTREALGL